MNAKKQTPSNPKFCLAAGEGFKGVRRGLYEQVRTAEYSRPHSCLPSSTVAGGECGRARR